MHVDRYSQPPALGANDAHVSARARVPIEHSAEGHRQKRAVASTGGGHVGLGVAYVLLVDMMGMSAGVQPPGRRQLMKVRPAGDHRETRRRGRSGDAPSIDGLTIRNRFTWNSATS
jgi:hypothetical protein